MKVVLSMFLCFVTLFSLAKKGDEYIPPLYVQSETKSDTVPSCKTWLKGYVNAEIYIDTSYTSYKAIVEIKNNRVWTDSTGYFEVLVDSGQHEIKVYCPDTSVSLPEDGITDWYTPKLITVKQNIYLKGGYITEIYANISYNLMDVSDKPVIYLYPEKEQEVNIEIDVRGTIAFSYPVYKNNWLVTAKPDGEITYKNNTYDYLFWEGKHANLTSAKDFESGFVIEGNKTIEFLEKSLTKIGLNASEKNDFITYWGPKMVGNYYNFIHFKFNEDYGKDVAGIKVTPEPKKMLRMFMVFAPLKEFKVVEEQEIIPFIREGFTVIEWGGSQINLKMNQFEN